MSRKYVPDDRYKDAPPIPTDRPPTRAEVWAYVNHLYHDLKTEAELRAFAIECWVGNYVSWVNLNEWSKPPDWKPGDPETPKVKGPLDFVSTNYAALKRLMGET